ncbi:MAG: DUF2189 domain-containing protein [Rhodospirillales bacterium]|nr:MAG: DUF2189 domain-containing protein [Rhodospirillales bacterium]
MSTEASVGAGTYRLPVTLRRVEIDRSGQWLAAGWRDFLKTPGVSLIYGGAFTVVSFALSYGLILAGLGSLVLPLAGGFVLLAPILVVGLYDVSQRLERGERAHLSDVFGAFRENLGQLAALGVALLVLWLVWVEVAIVLFAIFFGQAPPPLDVFVQEVVLSVRGVPFLLVGSLIGAGFALTIFAITAISVPLLYDRPLDVITAIAASVLAVRSNWRVMFGWAALIALIAVCGLALFFVGLAVALPVLAYATWHAYRDLVAPEVLQEGAGAAVGAADADGI